MNARKPHAELAGFVCERKARLGGHVVVYDRKSGFDCDAGERWIVQHEPSGRHVAIATEASARATMKSLAEARTLHDAQLVADLFPAGGEDLEPVDRVDEEPAAASGRRQLEALDRYMDAQDLATERAAWRDLVEASPASTRRGGRS